MAKTVYGLVILLFLGLGAMVAAGQPARADAYGMTRLRVGIADTSQFRTVQDRLEPFRAYLSEHLGLPVELHGFRSGEELVDAVARHAIDYAIVPAAVYAAAWRRCGCLEPLVAPKSIDGTAGSRSILVVRGDSPYLKPADLQGKALAASGPGSIAGRLVPFSELALEGADPATLFARVDTVTGPDAALAAVLDRKADAALAWTSLEGEEGEGYDRGILHDLVARHRLDMHAIRIIWHSGLIPNGPHAVRDDLPLELKQKLRDLLIDMIDVAPAVYDAVEPVYGGGFAPIGHSTYLPLLRLVTPAGEDPMQPPVPKAQVAPKG